MPKPAVRLADVPLVGVVMNPTMSAGCGRTDSAGRVTLIEGAARSGKSFVAFDLAARVSGGIAWPDSPQAAPGGDNAQPLEGCLLVCLQDNPADTLGRRLQLAGGDPNRLLHFSQFMSTDLKKRQSIRPARFPGDLPAIEYVLAQYEGIRLIVIDPLSAFCPTPGLLAETIHRLNDLAAEREIAVVVTLRATGRFDSRGRLEVKSRWPTDAARCAWFVAVDPNDDALRLFIPTRTNFCVEPQGLGFWIEAGRVLTPPRVDFQDPLQTWGRRGCRSLAEGDVPPISSSSWGRVRLYPDMPSTRARNRRLKQRIGRREEGHWKKSLQQAGLTAVMQSGKSNPAYSGRD